MIYPFTNDPGNKAEGITQQSTLLIMCSQLKTLNAEEIQRRPWGEDGFRGLYCKMSEVTVLGKK